MAHSNYAKTDNCFYSQWLCCSRNSGPLFGHHSRLALVEARSWPGWSVGGRRLDGCFFLHHFVDSLSLKQQHLPSSFTGCPCLTIFISTQNKFEFLPQPLVQKMVSVSWWVQSIHTGIQSNSNILKIIITKIVKNHYQGSHFFFPTKDFSGS